MRQRSLKEGALFDRCGPHAFLVGAHAHMHSWVGLVGTGAPVMGCAWGDDDDDNDDLMAAMHRDGSNIRAR